MIIECPFCNARIDVNPELIGKKATCSLCNREFNVTNPNLMPCPDCFYMISKRAATCPHCGAPQEGNSNAIPQNTTKEQEILVLHPSAMNYFFTIMLGVITCVCIIGLFILFYVWLDITCTTYRVTNFRVIVQRGLIAKTQNEIWIKDMRGVNLVQGVWQRILRIGNISIGTAATAGTEICMNGIRNPQKVVNTINSLRS